MPKVTDPVAQAEELLKGRGDFCPVCGEHFAISREASAAEYACPQDHTWKDMPTLTDYTLLRALADKVRELERTVQKYRDAYDSSSDEAMAENVRPPAPKEGVTDERP